MRQFNTMQEAFQYVIERLVIQAKRSGEVGKKGCYYFYTYETGAKLRCAVGHLLPDTCAWIEHEKINKTSVYDLIRNWQLIQDEDHKTEIFNWFNSVKDICTVQALTYLQEFHDDEDNWGSQEQFRLKAELLFTKLGLKLDTSTLDFSNWEK